MAETLARIQTATVLSFGVAVLVALPAAWFAWSVGHVLRHTDK